jgi:hypothetical protein
VSRRGPSGLGEQVALPAGRWTGERAATDILALVRKARAFGSLETLAPPAARQTVLYGGALALTAAILTWSGDTGAPVQDLTSAVIR